jgi:ppGpp synthetase/RelA/SpoT-type nucleotidyltranferase
VALTDDDISEIERRYVLERDRFEKLAAFVADACRVIVTDDAIAATVQWRAKDAERLRGKLQKKRTQYASVEDAFASIKDFAGVRVATYVDEDRARVVAAIAKRFAGPGGQDVAPDVREMDNGYRATHCQVTLTSDDLAPRYANLENTSCEIQICSLMAHVWNELQHDLEYKELTGEISQGEGTALKMLSDVTSFGDKLIAQLMSATADRVESKEGRFADLFEFVVRTRPRFPSAVEFNNNSGQLYNELVVLGYESPDAIDQGVIRGQTEADAQAILDGFTHYLGEDDALSLDATSSDLLLMLLLEQHADEIKHRNPGGRGRGRPPRIASVAKRFIDWRTADEHQ